MILNLSTQNLFIKIIILLGIRSLIEISRITSIPPSSSKCSTPYYKLLIHYLNNFRRKPAMSEFDWPFTPKHASSQYFATYTGSVYFCPIIFVLIYNKYTYKFDSVKFIDLYCNKDYIRKNPLYILRSSSFG